ncbi:hypothetical protein PMAYCL1PPCAC_16472, partial [Pristionchus mayeri]
YNNHDCIFQFVLFKNFFGKFAIIEGIHSSAKYFKNNYFSLMTSLITCLEPNNLDGWVSDDDNFERKDEFRVVVRSFSKDYSKLCVPMARMDDFTDREFHALLILAYCDLNPSLDLPEEAFRLAIQTKIHHFDELQKYYRKELGLKDFSHRLGTLLTFAQGVEEAGNLLYEELAMYAAMFGTDSEDRLFSELF